MQFSYFDFSLSVARSRLLLSFAYTHLHVLLPRVSELAFYKMIGVTSLLLHTMVVRSHYKIE